MARVIQLIETESKVGSGTTEDPVRIVLELWTLDGIRVAGRDTWDKDSFYCPKSELEIWENEVVPRMPND